MDMTTTPANDATAYFRLPAELLADVDTLAAADGRPRANMLRVLIADAMSQPDRARYLREHRRGGQNESHVA